MLRTTQHPLRPIPHIGIDSPIHLSRTLGEKNIQTDPNLLYKVWKKQKNCLTHKGFSAAIPQENDSITWDWNQLLVLQRKGEKTFIAYQNLTQFATYLKIDIYNARKLLNDSTQSEWKIIIDQSKSRVTSESEKQNLRVINIKKGEYEKRSADQPIPKHGLYHFIRKDAEKVIERIWVPK